MVPGVYLRLYGEGPGLFYAMMKKNISNVYSEN
jgi:hypothetical protein